MNLTSEPTTGEETCTYDFPVGMNALRKLVFELINFKSIICITKVTSNLVEIIHLVYTTGLH